ncbi:MAG: hypothetical protein EZS28_019595 [Streblomastix strix]|uniref:Sec16 central conserved domain-containing protein n=1 Tax=Streblomastix strix TaxID=222440 RepID=A0A5J4VR12_9EUKA|nr:MAG: hypothetical protein EZS28_019595 [Streblomastix strix]
MWNNICFGFGGSLLLTFPMNRQKGNVLKIVQISSIFESGRRSTSPVADYNPLSTNNINATNLLLSKFQGPILTATKQQKQTIANLLDSGLFANDENRLVKYGRQTEIGHFAEVYQQENDRESFQLCARLLSLLCADTGNLAVWSEAIQLLTQSNSQYNSKQSAQNSYNQQQSSQNQFNQSNKESSNQVNDEITQLLFNEKFDQATDLALNHQMFTTALILSRQVDDNNQQLL